MRGVVLIGEGRLRRTFDNDKAVGGRLMASVASGGEVMVADGESFVVPGLDLLFQGKNLFGDHCIEHLGERKVFENRAEIRDVAHDFLYLAKVIVRKRP